MAIMRMPTCLATTQISIPYVKYYTFIRKWYTLRFSFITFRGQLFVLLPQAALSNSPLLLRGSIGVCWALSLHSIYQFCHRLRNKKYQHVTQFWENLSVAQVYPFVQSLQHCFFFYSSLRIFVVAVIVCRVFYA